MKPPAQPDPPAATPPPAVADSRRIVAWLWCRQCADRVRLELPATTSEGELDELAAHFVCPRCAKGRADGASQSQLERTFTVACVASESSIATALKAMSLGSPENTP